MAALETPPRVTEAGTVIVAESDRAPYGQIVQAGRHRLAADEPEPIGADSGPTPYDYLLAALGSCTSMTLRMYANRKGWPVGRIQVALRRSRVPASSCLECSATAGIVDRIARDITITGPLTDEQRDGLARIADRCPVHRTLHGSVDVITTIALSSAGVGEQADVA